MKNLRRFGIWIATCLLMLFSAGIARAGDPANIGYGRRVESLFQNSTSVRIKGTYAEHTINSEIRDKARLDKLKWLMMEANPAFVGLFDAKTWGLSAYANNLSLTWLDKDKKEIGTIDLINGDTLIFHDNRVYEIPKLENATDVTLLVCTVSLAKPEVFNPKR